MKWAELDGHGYGMLEVTPARCRMDWYHLTDRTKKDSAVHWVQGWSVGAGSARIRPEPSPVV